jgi:hypothetical protein
MKKLLFILLLLIPSFSFGQLANSICKPAFDEGLVTLTFNATNLDTIWYYYLPCVRQSSPNTSDCSWGLTNQVSIYVWLGNKYTWIPASFGGGGSNGGCVTVTGSCNQNAKGQANWVSDGLLITNPLTVYKVKVLWTAYSGSCDYQGASVGQLQTTAIISQ